MTNGSCEPAPERCPLCGTTALVPLRTVRGGFSLVECSVCCLVLTHPPVSPQAITRYYPAEYYGRKNRRFHPLCEGLVTLLRGRRVREIERLASRGRVLDIGCGRGITLAQLQRRGWEVHGTELSDSAAAPAREVVGPTIWVGSILDAPYAANFFDVVILWHVLEHLPDPQAVLARCCEILRPGGLLVVAVPNFASLQSAVTGPHWFHLDVPRHYLHFREVVLRRVIADHGFVARTLRHFSFEQNPYGWIQSLLNGLGFRYNLLYDLLKKPEARSVPDPFRATPLQCILLVPALLLVFPLSLVLFLVEVALRRGGTIELYAQCVKGGPGAKPDV